MTTRLVGSILVLLSAAGLASAQSWTPAPNAFDGRQTCGPCCDGSGPGGHPCCPPGAPDATAFSDGAPPITNAFTDQDECPPPGCCGPCVWFTGEYLYWWLKGTSLPPLVTTAPGSPNLFDSAGILGVRTTTVLLGDKQFDNHDLSGGRVFLGGWLNDCRTLGLEVGYFGLGTSRNSFFTGSDGLGRPVISRPVINSQDNAETVLFIAAPERFFGTVNIDAFTQFQGAEANVLIDLALFQCGYQWPQIILGVRYLDLREELTIVQNSQILPGSQSGFNGGLTLPGDFLTLSDQFRTLNQFYGGQLGTRYMFQRGRWTVDVLGKVAAGINRQTLNVNGGTTLRPAEGGIQSVPGGLLALSSNIGRHKHDHFSLVPEGGVTLGFNITPNLRLTAGYTFLYWTNVIRSGESVDRTINPALLPTSTQFGSGTGPVRPAALFNQTDFWAHGASVGLKLEF